MNTLRLSILGIITTTLLVACNNTRQLIEQAHTHSCNNEWLQAAEVLSHIHPAEMAKIIDNGTSNESELFEKISSDILESNDIEAVKIYSQWIEDVYNELYKLQNKEKRM